MESANIHQMLHEHHQLIVGSCPPPTTSSSSLATSSCYGVSTATHDTPWNTHSSILNSTSSLNPHPNNEASLNQRQEESNNTLMAPNSSFTYWPNHSFTNIQSAEDLQQVSRIKEELAENYYLRYTELLGNNSPCSSSNDQEPMHSDHHLSTKFLLKSFSSGNLVESKDRRGGLSYSGNVVDVNSRKGFSQVFPRVPVSNLLNEAADFSTSHGPSLDMNLEALDLLTSSRLGGNYMNPSFENQIGLMRDGFFNHGFDHRMHQQSPQLPMHSSISNKVTNSNNGAEAAEVKRPRNKIDSYSKPINQTTAAKKPRLEPRPSCPPFKVRKEKLGDRIAALQQLVAPFGKTDTATVLMEATGYIKFLQNQVETLSVPYMKSARNNKSNRLTNGCPIDRNEEEEEPKIDLKSRGLCLVPSSCLSYITEGGGGGAVVWPPSRYDCAAEQASLNY